MTIFKVREPSTCPKCDGLRIRRILTEEDLPKLKK